MSIIGQAMNFTPKELAKEIQQHVPKFSITYKIDYRQVIADSWPDSIDDSKARRLGLVSKLHAF